jgi:hypothetical protein
MAENNNKNTQTVQAGSASGTSGSSSDYNSLVTKLLEMESSAQMQKIRQLILLRTALESDVRPTRMPAPKNITELGGYYNLLRKMNQQNMMRQMVASAVGIPNDASSEMTEEIIRKLIADILADL